LDLLVLKAFVASIGSFFTTLPPDCQDDPRRSPHPLSRPAAPWHLAKTKRYGFWKGTKPKEGPGVAPPPKGDQV